MRTRVGYAGGTTRNPTYESIGDHTETIQIDFDPAVLAYEDLLTLFWNSHNPCGQAYSAQYRSVILFHDQAQQAAAERTKAEQEAKLGRRVTTSIEPLAQTAFTYAEDYHQKFTLRQFKRLVADLDERFASDRELVDSTLAARLNGYLAYKGDPAQLERELPLMDLAPEHVAKLRERVGGR